MDDPIETNLEIALKGMTSSDKEERAAVVPALLEVQKQVPDKTDPRRIRADALRLLVETRNSPQYCCPTLTEFVPIAHKSMGENSAIVIELYRAYAISAYCSTGSQKGGKPKALKNMKKALALISKFFGPEHTAYAKTEKLMEMMNSQPTHSYRPAYDWILL